MIWGESLMGRKRDTTKNVFLGWKLVFEPNHGELLFSIFMIPKLEYTKPMHAEKDHSLAMNPLKFVHALEIKKMSRSKNGISNGTHIHE